ncbi:glycosyltransferase family 2 protein [Hoyosella sp. G463]|uniref:Glycosyltransferase family 2 protein n=1 Tax=Lolliginicoccus lacisalsi TaxID=2742202 RepID=A0A927PMD6_9ACTN|nr:glycosyltransferase family 2 protein [Lolliginicoccus lacisalsi]MBD8506377.1 glycosyltransferase family 2 protein [Lolliginicoccus lacisalsi]
MNLSVVVPAFNEEDAIEPCLEALVSQRELPHEIIVVDNASTDGTAAAVSRFRERSPVPIKLVHEPAPGVAAARNRGFAEVTGEIIARIDADTRVEPEWSSAIVDFFAGKGAGFDAAVGPISKYDAPLRGLDRAGMALITRVATMRGSENTEVRRVNSLVGSNMAITPQAWRDIKDDVSLSREKWDDTDVSLLLGKAGKQIAFVPGMRAGISGRRGRTSRQAFWRYSASLPRTLRMHGRLWEARASWITVWIMRTMYLLVWVPNRAYDPETERYSWSRLRTGSEHRAHPGGDAAR